MLRMVFVFKILSIGAVADHGLVVIAFISDIFIFIYLCQQIRPGLIDYPFVSLVKVSLLITAIITQLEKYIL